MRFNSNLPVNFCFMRNSIHFASRSPVETKGRFFLAPSFKVYNNDAFYENVPVLNSFPGGVRGLVWSGLCNVRIAFPDFQRSRIV